MFLFIGFTGYNVWLAGSSLSSVVPIAYHNNRVVGIVSLFENKTLNNNETSFISNSAEFGLHYTITYNTIDVSG